MEVSIISLVHQQPLLVRVPHPIESLVQCFSHLVIRHSHLAPLGVKDPEINNARFYL